jgi:hypothetical protein
VQKPEAMWHRWEIAGHLLQQQLRTADEMAQRVEAWLALVAPLMRLRAHLAEQPLSRPGPSAALPGQLRAPAAQPPTHQCTDQSMLVADRSSAMNSCDNDVAIARHVGCRAMENYLSCGLHICRGWRLLHTAAGALQVICILHCTASAVQIQAV